MTTASETDTTFSLQVLGPVVARRDGDDVNLGGEKQRAVLGMLIAAVGGSVDRDVLIEGVWGDEATDANRRSLHTYVSNLRSLIGADITRSGSTYSLRIDRSAVDWVAFEKVLDEAADLLSTSPQTAADRLRTALAWWRGRPYANAADAPGLQAEIRRLQERRLTAVELRIDADLAQGRHTRLIPELDALVVEYPFRERFRSQHMIALYGAGRQADALRSYQQVATHMAEEVGLEPSRELRDLEMRILSQDETLLSGISHTLTQRRAFLFTDIEGSTRLWDVNPDAMGRALGRHDDILREAITGTSGKAFKHTGDGMLCAFPTVATAVAAAESAQRTLQQQDWGPLGEIKVRMGIDVGDVDARGDDFFGPPVNRCTRIMNAAHGGQVLLSLAAQEELTRTPIEGVQVRYLGEHRLRGLGDVERIGQLVFIGLPADFPELRVHIQGPDPLHSGFGDAIRGYELRGQLGAGTFGVVYRAYQPAVGREVATKVIRPEYANHPGFVRRFESEARLVARLEHPHIVPLFDYWRDQAGAYLVMRLMRGGTLSPRMGTPWAPFDAMRLLRQTGGALAAAHRQNVVHRDLKPANILLDDDGNAYLADFGIAARIMEPVLGSSMTSSLQRYRAPEDVGDAPAGNGSDIYSLAVLTFELLTGDQFSAGDRPAGSVDPALPVAAAAVIARGTARDPRDRFATVDEYLEALGAALADVIEGPVERIERTEIRNPYKGLRPFAESDRGDFFGREGLVDTLLAAIQRQRLVTVVGPSGSGKSSAVHAGLLPRLRDGAIPGSNDWLYVVLTPGTHPFESLVTALQSVATEAAPDLARALTEDEVALNLVAAELLDGLDGNVVLVVDQFEEVFTLVDNEEVRDRFLRMLTTAVTAPDSKVRAVLTLRADFFDRPLAYEHIGPQVSSGHVTVIPPTRTELIEAIERPAATVGLRVEPGLAARIAEDVGGQPGGLPLMQYALAELVDARSTDQLTTGDYEDIGGVTGALGRRAEQVYLDLPGKGREAARIIFLRLVTVDANTDDSRRRARRSELEALDLDPTTVTDVVRAFGSHRLLSFDRDVATRTPTVEVAHEALLREWPRLGGWIEDERGDLVLGRRFRAAMADWDRSGRAADYLLTGDRLAPFVLWSRTASLTVDELEFLDAGRAADEAAQLARRRRRRVLTGVLAIATAVSLAFAALALIQRNEAQESAALGEAQVIAARSSALVDEDPDLAMVLAVEAAQRSDLGTGIVAALRDAVGAHPTVFSYTWPEERLVTAAGGDLSPDGSRLVVAPGTGNYLEVSDTESGALVWSKEFPWDEPDEIRVDAAVFFASGGDEIVGSVVYEPGAERAEHPPPDFVGIYVWDTATGAELRRFDVGRCGARMTMAADADRYTVITRLSDELIAAQGCAPIAGEALDPQPLTVERLDVTTGDTVLVTTLDGSTSFFGAPRVALSADGRVVLYDTGGAEGTVFAVEVETGRVLLEDADYWGYQGAALSPDGALVAMGGEPNELPLIVIDLATGERVSGLEGHDGGTTGIWFSSDGGVLYTSGDDGLVRLWDPATGYELDVIPGGDGAARTVARMTPDGSRLVTFSVAGTARVVSLDPRDATEVSAFVVCDSPGFVPSRSLDTAGPAVLLYEYCVDGGQLLRLEPESGTTGQLIDAVAGQKAALSPDGSLVAAQRVVPGPSGSDGFGQVVVYESATGALIRELDGLCVWEFGDPNVLAPDCVDAPARPYRAFAWDLDFSRDGSLLAMAADDDEAPFVHVWDVADGTTIAMLEMNATSLAFSPTADLLFAGNADQMWMVDTTDFSVVSHVTTVEGQAPTWASKFTPDGSLIVATQELDAGAGGIAILDPLTLEVVDTIPDAHEAGVRDLAVSSDGSMFASAGTDGAIKVWELATGLLLDTIRTGGRVNTVAFVNNDRRLLAAPVDGRFVVFTLDPTELLEIARSRVARNLTAEECERYLPEGTCPG